MKELEHLRKRRNDHAKAIKNVMTIENGLKWDRELERHRKVGKDFKKDIEKYSKELEKIEIEMM